MLLIYEGILTPIQGGWISGCARSWETSGCTISALADWLPKGDAREHFKGRRCYLKISAHVSRTRPSAAAHANILSQLRR